MSEQPISLKEVELKVGGVTMLALSGLEPAIIEFNRVASWYIALYILHTLHLIMIIICNVCNIYRLSCVTCAIYRALGFFSDKRLSPVTADLS